MYYVYACVIRTATSDNRVVPSCLADARCIYHVSVRARHKITNILNATSIRRLSGGRTASRWLPISRIVIGRKRQEMKAHAAQSQESSSPRNHDGTTRRARAFARMHRVSSSASLEILCAFLSLYFFFRSESRS